MSFLKCRIIKYLMHQWQCTSRHLKKLETNRIFEVVNHLFLIVTNATYHQFSMYQKLVTVHSELLKQHVLSMFLFATSPLYTRSFYGTNEVT